MSQSSLSKGSRKPVIFVTLVLLFLGTFFSTFSFVPSVDKANADTPSWYNSSWQYRKKITIDHTKVSADQTNFPVYVDLSSDPDLAAHAQANGNDILFTAADGVTKLDHDLSRPTATDFVTTDGAWCWFQDPKAVHYEGTQNQTYVGWVNASGDILIGSYNHNAQTMDVMTLHPALQIDDHADPSILMRPDGRLMVFYSAHGGANMFYRLSANPEDISSWGAEQTVGTNTPGGNGYSYPNPVQLSGESNKIYLFWRGGNWEPTFSSSTDGISWSAAQTLFNVPGQRPYTKVVSDGTGKIHFTFTDGHPASVTNNNIYYAYYYNGSFYKADGTLIKTMADVVAGNPLLPAEVDKVYDAVTGGSRAWNWDIALDSSGYPIIVYANFPTTSDHRYRYARWTGSAWDDHEITPAGGYIDGPGEPYYSGGITLDHNNPSIAYLSRQISGQFEIQKWTTSDGGTSWSAEDITSGSNNKNVRPIVPRGYTSGDLEVIWMNGDYPSYSSYKTALKIQSAPISVASILETHIKIPLLSSTVDTDIFMYYGNPTASDQSNPGGVWDTNFKMVQHLNDWITNFLTHDSTTNNNYGTKKTNNEPNEIIGKINKAQNFNGLSDYINTGAGINMSSWGALTFEAWIKYEKGTNTSYTIISNWVATSDKAAVLARIKSAGDTLQAYVMTQPNASVGGDFADVHFDSNWHHLVITYNAPNGLKTYLDNVASATTYASTASLDADTSVFLNIGYAPHAPLAGFKGRIDEVRISDTLRSTTWISTEYNNQSSPSTFYHAGLEEPLTAPTVTAQVADSITVSFAVLHGTITNVGTQNATIRGFKYYQSADCTGAENDKSENGSFGAEAYSLNLTGLASNTLFSYKAYATSPAGTGTSATCEAFATLSNGGEPTPTSTPTPSPTPTPDSSESSTATPTESTTATPAEESTPTHPWWWRLFYGTTGDTSPTDSFTTTPTDLSAIEVGQEIIFDASSLGSDIDKYEWNFGDGTTASGVRVNHKYEKPGRYTITLTTTDKSGDRSTYTQIIDIRPPAPTISDIKAEGTSIVFEGKSFPEATVDLTIHSNPYSGQAVADKDGEFTYTVEQGSETLGEGDHTVFASATIILSDNTQLKSEDSKTYDFKVSVDDGKLKVEMGKTRTWQYISLGLILIIAILLGYWYIRSKRSQVNS